MSAALVRWGATAGARQHGSGAAQDGGGQTTAAPGMGDGVAAAISEAATLLTRDAAADSPAAVALRAAQRTRLAQEEKRRAAAAAEAQAEAAASAAPSRPATASGEPHGIAGVVREQQRWRQDHGGEPPRAAPSDRPHGVLGMSREKAQRRAQEEAERRRIADERYQLARNEAVIAAGMMASDDGRSALVHRIIRDLGIGTEPGSERVNHNFIAERDAYYQRQARAEKRAAEERARQADLEAERRKKSDAVRDTETGRYVGPDEEGKRFLESAANAERFYRLNEWDWAANEVERGWRQIQSSSAIGRVQRAPDVQAEIAADIEAAIREKKRTRFLSPDTKNILANKDRLERIAASESQRALRDLQVAEALRAQILQSPGLQKLRDATTAEEFIEVVVNHPMELLAIKAGQAVPKVIARGAGMALAGPLGGIVAASYTAFGWKYAEAVVKGFEDKGIDLQNENAVREAVKNKDLMREIYNDALKAARIAAGAQVTWGLVRYGLSAPQPSKP